MRPRTLVSAPDTGAVFDVPGSKAQKAREASQRCYARRISEGLCGHCGGLNSSGRAMCDKCRAKTRDWRAAQPVRVQELAGNRNARVRAEVFDHYGNWCTCCGEDVPAMLTLDHIDGDGADWRREMFGSRLKAGARTYDWIKRNNFPAGIFQTLCFNCNVAKHRLGVCPHSNNVIALMKKTG